jgi:hypothetical protein
MEASYWLPLPRIQTAYRFDNLASGTYRLVENAPGYVTQGVQIQNTLSNAVAVNGNTQILVTLTEPDDAAWQDPDPIMMATSFDVWKRRFGPSCVRTHLRTRFLER